MKLELPLSFDDITIRMIQRHGDRDIDDIEKVCIFTGQTQDEIKDYPYELIKKGAEHIDSILSTPTQKHYKIIEIEGQEYGFIPDWSKFSTGEYIDVDNYSKDVIKNAHKIMSILYRPITRKYKDTYEIEPYKGTDGDKFKDVSIGWYYGTLVFFSTIRSRYAMTSLKSLVGVTEELLFNKSSQKNGVGTTFLSRLRVKIYLKWKKLRGYRLRKA